MLRWKPFTSSIFSTMSEHALRTGAVNLSQGFPDFAAPPEILEGAIEAIRAGHNQYAPAWGIPELRRFVAERREAACGEAFDPGRNVTVFSGATEGIFSSILALFSPGDEILAFEPWYESYPAAAVAAGCRIRGIPLQPPDWRIQADDLHRVINHRTRGLILNTPHNPTGKVFSQDELEMLAELCVRHNLLVITDEVYEELVYDGRRHISICSLPGMRERTVTISSTSKTFSLTGWKVGYGFADDPLMEAIRAVHMNTVFCSATPLQHGILAAMEFGDQYYTDLRQRYEQRRDELHGILTRAGFRCPRPAGTYFILADYSPLSKAGDYDFALQLTREAGVTALPVSSFYEDSAAAGQAMRFLRFGFCKKPETIAAAGKKLNQWHDDYGRG